MKPPFSFPFQKGGVSTLVIPLPMTTLLLLPFLVFQTAVLHALEPQCFLKGVASPSDVACINNEFRAQSSEAKKIAETTLPLSGGTLTGSTTATILTATTLNTSVLGVSSLASFSNAAGTTTFSGWVDIGLEIITTNCGTAAGCTATCSAGKRLLGGGCYIDLTGAALGRTYPSANNVWSCYTDGGVAGNHTAYAICARVE